MTADRIELGGMRVLGRCGATAEERALLQPLEVDLELVADLGKAGHSDKLADTIDYALACAAVADVASGGPVALLEHLAQRIADVVLGSDPRIEAVVVAVRKLRPPVPHHLASAGVRITRSR